MTLPPEWDDDVEDFVRRVERVSCAMHANRGHVLNQALFWAIYWQVGASDEAMERLLKDAPYRWRDIRVGHDFSLLPDFH